MKRAFKFIMSLLIVFSFLTSINIIYAEPDNEQVPKKFSETIYNNGQVHVVIDTESNRPDDFYDYNFYVNFVNTETGEWIVKTIHYNLNYDEIIDLPFGKYEIGEAGVKKDYLGKFTLIGGKPFELNATNKSAEVYLSFPESHIVNVVNTPSPSPKSSSAVETIMTTTNNSVNDIGKITWYIDTEKQPMGGMEITLYIIDNYNIEKQIILNEGNEYKNTIDLPAGIYKINQEKTTIQNNDNITCMIDNESVQLSSNSNIECEVYLCEREQTEATEKEIFALNKGITVGAGIVLLIVIFIGLWQVKKYI